MGFFNVFADYRDRRCEISTDESLGTLNHMMDFFGDGEHWAQGVYQGNDGGRCLVGAAAHVRVSNIDDAKHWLRIAIKEKTGLDSIEQFNDTRNSFEEIKEIINRAMELARAGAAKAATVLVGEVLPPVRAALPAPAAVTALPVLEANQFPSDTNPWVAPMPAPAPRARNTQATRPSLREWRD
jgi:hypothetical protein